MGIATQQRDDLAKEIKEGREALGLDQDRFAQLIGVATRTLQRYEAGKSVPDAITYKIILGLFQNLYFQEINFVSASRSRILASKAFKGSRTLTAIKCSLFDCIIQGNTSFLYQGNIGKSEAAILQALGYKIEISNSCYLISF